MNITKNPRTQQGIFLLEQFDSSIQESQLQGVTALQWHTVACLFMSCPLCAVDKAFTTDTTHIFDGLAMFPLMASQQPFIQCCIITALTSPCFIFMDSGMFSQIGLAKVAFITARIGTYCCFNLMVGELVNF